ncbi:MAG: hypothetical protein ACTHOH_14460 [Lysobacteraceae bacterium]
MPARSAGRRTHARAQRRAPAQFRCSVSREEQLRRFKSRRNDPLKHWKLAPIDLQSLDKWPEYTEARRRCPSTPTPQTRMGG